MFTPDFFTSLRVMGLGMAGIFTVVAIFFVIIAALNKFMPHENE